MNRFTWRICVTSLADGRATDQQITKSTDHQIFVRGLP